MIYFYRGGHNLLFILATISFHQGHKDDGESVSAESRFLPFLLSTFFSLLLCGTLKHQDSSVPLLQRLRGEWTPLTSCFRKNDNATCRVPDWKFSPSHYFFLFHFWGCFLIVKKPAEYPPYLLPRFLSPAFSLVFNELSAIVLASRYPPVPTLHSASLKDNILDKSK